MKTSKKLIITFFAAIPLSLFGYNLLLKRQYDRGEFFANLLPYERLAGMNKRNLPAARHVVIDGAVQTLDGPVTSFRPSIMINLVDSNVNRLFAEPIYDRLIQYTVSGDTLYIGLKKDHLNPDLEVDDPEYNAGEWDRKRITLFLSGMPGFSLRNATYTLNRVPKSGTIEHKRDLLIDLFKARVTVREMPLASLSYKLISWSNLQIDNRELIDSIRNRAPSLTERRQQSKTLTIISPERSGNRETWYPPVNGWR